MNTSPDLKRLNESCFDYERRRLANPARPRDDRMTNDEGSGTAAVAENCTVKDWTELPPSTLVKVNSVPSGDDRFTSSKTALPSEPGLASLPSASSSASSLDLNKKVAPPVMTTLASSGDCPKLPRLIANTPL